MPEMPPAHRPAGWRPRQEVKAEADARRGSARERGYTTAWDKAARGFLARHPLCLGCAAIGRTEAATLVDHTIPHRGDQALFWDADNRQPSCRWHHDVIKQILERMFDAGDLAAADLRLDSPRAIALTRERGGGG